MSETERFLLPGGEEVGTGLLMPTELAIRQTVAYPVYGETWWLDKADIKRSLENDMYKTWRRVRSRWMLNQASLGKCNASATVAAFHNRRMLEGHPHEVLSDCYLYMNINGGADQGSLLIDGLEFSKQGIAPRKFTYNGQEYLIPSNVYNKSQISREMFQGARDAADDYKSFEAYRLPTTSYGEFKIALASALARDHQVIFAWHVGNNSMSLRNGYAQQGRGPGNHATVFHSGKWVDGDDLVHPDCQNSWGPSKDAMYGPVGTTGWGEGGFGLFTMESAFQCARNHAFWVLTGSKVTKKVLK